MDVQSWQEPEPRASAGAAKVVADALRAEKDKWAIIEEYDVPADASEAKKVRAKASSRASLIKQGRVAAFRSTAEGWPGTFQAVSRSGERKNEDGSTTKIIRVFARYVGEEFATEPKAKDAKVADGSGPSETEAADATPVDEVAANA